MNFPRLNKTQWFITLLIALNLITLGLLFNSRRGGHSPMSRRYAEKNCELDLNAEQRAQFDTLDNRFFQKTKPLYDELSKRRKETLFVSAQNPADSAALQAALAASARLHFQLDSLRVDHFLHLRAVCTPAQQEQLRDMCLRRIDARPRSRPSGHQSSGR